MGPTDEIVPLTSGFASVENAVRQEPPEGGDAPRHRNCKHYLRASRTVRTDCVTCANSHWPPPRNVYGCTSRRRGLACWNQLVVPTRGSYRPFGHRSAGLRRAGLHSCTVVSLAATMSLHDHPTAPVRNTGGKLYRRQTQRRLFSEKLSFALQEGTPSLMHGVEPSS